MTKHLKERLWRAIKRPDSDVHPQDMEWIGVNNLMRAAKWLNRIKFRNEKRNRQRYFRNELDVLLRENGAPMADHGFMNKGYLLDHSCQWPHLGELIAQCEEIIDVNGMIRTGVPGREWIRDIMTWSFLETYPAILDFITSTDVLNIACRYAGYIPMLSGTVPPGFRLAESHQSAEAAANHVYARSQLHHLDIHDSHMVYVIVLLRDVTADNGPFCFLDSEASARVAKAMNYGRRGNPYRLRDEDVYRVVDPNEVHVVTGKAGTVLFLDPSRCFHFGSREPLTARYQAMYALVSPCRADFTEWYMKPRPYPVRESDSRLRRLVLEKKPHLM